MLPTSRNLTILTIVLIALTIVMPQLLLIIIPTAAILMMLNSLGQTYKLQRATIPVKANRVQPGRTPHRNNHFIR